MLKIAPLMKEEQDQLFFCVGLILALSSSVFIGSSFIIKKISLLKLSRKGSVRAGAGGFGYLKDWLWWLGLITMGVGELANFAAYAFAPASLVTPLGALSVLVSTILASRFLQETLSGMGKMGCILCIIGSIIIIIHAPKEQEVSSFIELKGKIHDPFFIKYLIFTIVISGAVIFYLGPRYGNKHITVYIILCSAVGSVTVMACKALGLALENIFSGTVSDAEYYESIYWSFSLFVVLILCISLQMTYLNKSLDIFNANLVTPVYYVIFTTLVIVSSAILFREWENMVYWDVVGSLCGFFVVVVAIFLLQRKESKNLDIIRVNSEKLLT